MTPDSPLKILSEVRDLQIVDRDGTLCGIADDIEFEGALGEELRVAAILVGPGALMARLPRVLRPLIRILAGTRTGRVPWSEVDSITSRITLKSRATSLRLGSVDRRLRARFPKAGAV